MVRLHTGRTNGGTSNEVPAFQSWLWIVCRGAAGDYPLPVIGAGQETVLGPGKTKQPGGNLYCWNARLSRHLGESQWEKISQVQHSGGKIHRSAAERKYFLHSVNGSSTFP